MGMARGRHPAPLGAAGPGFRRGVTLHIQWWAKPGWPVSTRTQLSLLCAPGLPLGTEAALPVGSQPRPGATVGGACLAHPTSVCAPFSSPSGHPSPQHVSTQVLSSGSRYTQAVADLGRGCYVPCCVPGKGTDGIHGAHRKAAQTDPPEQSRAWNRRSGHPVVRTPHWLPGTGRQNWDLRQP